LTEQQIDQLFDQTFAFVGFQLTIDLEKQTVRTTDGNVEFPFEVAAFRKYCMINGFDDIALTLRHKEDIQRFEAERLLKQPWLANRVLA